MENFQVIQNHRIILGFFNDAMAFIPVHRSFFSQSFPDPGVLRPGFIGFVHPFLAGPE